MPQIGFSRLIIRISSRTSLETADRPGLPCRIFQVRNKREPLRCQPMTVAGFMMKAPDLQSCQTVQIQTHSSDHRPSVVVASRSVEEHRLMPEGEDLKRKRRMTPE